MLQQFVRVPSWVVIYEHSKSLTIGKRSTFSGISQLRAAHIAVRQPFYFDPCVLSNVIAPFNIETHPNVLVTRGLMSLTFFLPGRQLPTCSRTSPPQPSSSPPHSDRSCWKPPISSTASFTGTKSVKLIVEKRYRCSFVRLSCSVFFKTETVSDFSNGHSKCSRLEPHFTT